MWISEGREMIPLKTDHMYKLEGAWKMFWFYFFILHIRKIRTKEVKWHAQGHTRTKTLPNRLGHLHPAPWSFHYTHTNNLKGVAKMSDQINEWSHWWPKAPLVEQSHVYKVKSTQIYCVVCNRLEYPMPSEFLSGLFTPIHHMATRNFSKGVPSTGNNFL